METHQLPPPYLSYDQRRQLSMKMSRLLRHDQRFYSLYLDPRALGLNEDEVEQRINGFAALNDLVRYLSEGRRMEGIRRGNEYAPARIHEESLREIVDDQLKEVGRAHSKIRFELNAKRTHVRALSGHSNGVRLDYKRVPLPAVAFHLTNDVALEKILAAGEGIRPMGRDCVHMYSKLVPARLNPSDSKRSVIVQVNFAKDQGETVAKNSLEYLLDPELNYYLFSRKVIPAELLERKCTVQEYITNGYKFT